MNTQTRHRHTHLLQEPAAKERGGEREREEWSHVIKVII